MLQADREFQTIPRPVLTAVLQVQVPDLFATVVETAATLPQEIAEAEAVQRAFKETAVQVAIPRQERLTVLRREMEERHNLRPMRQGTTVATTVVEVRAHDAHREPEPGALEEQDM